MQGIKQAKEIREGIAKKYGYTVEQLEGAGKQAGLAAVRMYAMAIIRQKCHLSLQEIGWIFGSRDHSTVAHAIKWYEKHRGLFDTSKEA